MFYAYFSLIPGSFLCHQILRTSFNFLNHAVPVKESFLIGFIFPSCLSPCVFILGYPLYCGCLVRASMTIDVHLFWRLILKAHHIKVKKNLHFLFGLWSKIHNGSSKVLTKQFFRNRSRDPSFEPKFYADQEFQ